MAVARIRGLVELSLNLPGVAALRASPQALCCRPHSRAGISTDVSPSRHAIKNKLHLTCLTHLTPGRFCRPHSRAGISTDVSPSRHAIKNKLHLSGATRLTPGFMLSPAFAGWDINRCESFAPRYRKQIAAAFAP